MARAKTKTAPAGRYSVHPGVTMMQEWVRTLHEKTGRSLEQWVALLERQGPADEKARRDWLKEKHGLGTNAAWWLAARSVGKGYEDSDPALYLEAAEGWVEAMYAGGKAGLRPVYEALLARGLALGPDVRACPCKTIVPLYRRRVFAELKPSTRTRLDLGLVLGDEPAKGRLAKTDGRNRISHRIAIGAIGDIDCEVERWLRTAYERDAG
jgi:uncharacterized protein DUF5655/uncharacterized protein DUF4287